MEGDDDDDIFGSEEETQNTDDPDQETPTPEPEEEDIDQIMSDRGKRTKYIEEKAKEIFPEKRETLGEAASKVLIRFARKIRPLKTKTTNEGVLDDIFDKDADKEIKANYNYKKELAKIVRDVKLGSKMLNALNEDYDKLKKFVKILNQIIDSARPKSKGDIEERLANKLKPLIKEMLRRNK